MNFDETMLISMLRENVEVAYEHLVELYADKIYQTSLFMLGNTEDAKDAVQDVFIAVHSNIKKFRHESELSTWIYRITVNSCLSICRKNAKSSKAERAAKDNEFFCDIFASADSKIIVKDAILSLDEKYRAVIILRDINGLPYETISGIMRLPVGTVKSRVNRARCELRKKLSDSLLKGDEQNGVR